MDEWGDLRCAHCGATGPAHFQNAAGEWRNRCPGCGQESEYMPTLEEIRRACARLRCESAHLEITDEEERFWRRAGAWQGESQDDGEDDAADIGLLP